MIELIFVIVILGILAAVAIPKMAATRDDANVAKARMEIARAINDIGSFYTSKGYFTYEADTMTNVDLILEGGGSGEIPSDATAHWNYLVKGDNCLDMNATGDGNVSVIVGDSSSTLCTRIQAGAQSLINGSPYIYSGGNVNLN